MIEARRLLAVVDIPDDLQGIPQQQVASPVNIDNAAGIRGAEIRLRYDPTVLDITTAQIVKGSVWGTDPNVQVVANVDAASGTVAVFIFGANDLAAGAGSLVNFNFTVRAGATVGSTTILDLTEVRLNEGGIPVTPPPQVGADATDGVITIIGNGGGGGSGVISGRVFADSNLNNLIDAHEGIPAVAITLVNTATNSQTTVTTSATGEFQFTDVEPGTYRIVQKQPVAFINGGPNEISVTIADGQSLTEQNFREIGLKPEYVYSRLFTTLVMPVGSTAWTSTVERIVTDAENGIMRAISVTAAPNPFDSAAKSLSMLSSVIPTATASDAPPVEDSAGEFVETTASSVPQSAGEAVDTQDVDAALALASDPWVNVDPQDLAGAAQSAPPTDDDLLLALLAVDEAAASSAADELLGS